MHPRGQRKVECKQSGSQRVPGTQHPAPLQARAAGADGAGALRWGAPSLPPAVDRKERKREKKDTHMRDRPAVSGVQNRGLLHERDDERCPHNAKKSKNKK